MVAVDTNCIIAYLAGDSGEDIDLLDQLLARKLAVLPPVVVAELLSDPILPADAERMLRSLPEVSISDGYWYRAGKLRCELTKLGYKARLADTLIAQSCLDSNVALLTRDKGFRRFEQAGLRLV